MIYRTAGCKTDQVPNACSRTNDELATANEGGHRRTHCLGWGSRANSNSTAGWLVVRHSFYLQRQLPSASMPRRKTPRKTFEALPSDQATEKAPSCLELVKSVGNEQSGYNSDSDHSILQGLTQNHQHEEDIRLLNICAFFPNSPQLTFKRRHMQDW